MTSYSERQIGDDGAFREAQEREAATREILKVLSRSRDDEKPVFDAILENAARLCSVPTALLFLVNEEKTHFLLADVWGEWANPKDAGEAWPLDGSLPVAQSIREARTIHLEDVAETAAYRDGDPTYVYLVEEEGLHTRLCVPLVHDGTALGAIALSRHEVRPFSGDEIALVETFAEQAVIAIENVRQFRELQTRLQREAATREVLEVISLHPDNEQPVFDAIMNCAARLCDAPHAALMLCNAENTHLLVAASNEANSGYAEMLRQNPHSMSDTKSLSVEAVTSMQVRQYADIEVLKDYAQPSEQLKITWDLERMRTLLYVPLIKGDRAIGALVLYRLEVKEFTSDDIELLKIFAAQAVIAIENVKQFRELQTRLEREAATREILQVISQSRADETPVFDVILENASRLCNAPLAFLSMANEKRTHATVPAHRGALSGFASVLDDFRLPIAGSKLVAVRPIAECTVIRIDDISETEMYRDREPYRVAMVEDEGIRSILGVPLISGGHGIGAIILYRREVAPFSDDDVALVESFAAQAVIAVENVKQFKALQARTEEVQALNENLESRVATQVDELERMGRLKRFLSPQVADAVLSSGDDKLLSSHRALIATLFCDMRGFTAFCETAEPEEAIEVLQAYHEEMGALIVEYGAGVDHRSGDGIMVIFNDPFPCDSPAEDAVKLALAMRERMAGLCADWRKLGHRLGFGVGISLGFATVGVVGSAGRYDYTASGTAVNLAARLCDQASNGEILLSPRAYKAVEDAVVVEPAGELKLKGIQAPVEVVRVIRQKDAEAPTDVA